MSLSLYVIDAFTDTLFGGSSARSSNGRVWPAAVCPLDAWLDDATLQAIAAENNLSETAFFIPLDDQFALRWFTPLAEVDLCGHATLASAFVVFNHLRPSAETVRFQTRSGWVTVERRGSRLTLDFPARPGEVIDAPPGLVEGLGRAPRAVLRARDVLCVFDSADEVRGLKPNTSILAEIDALGILATAPGDLPGVDFVSRCFFPRVGIPEDPVTGSAHCTLIPYWAARLGRNVLEARQLSRRGGRLWCELRGDRVGIGGQAVEYLRGTIHV